MTKVLWLTPNFNHYKARFLNHLAKETDIDLNILSGTGRVGFGDKEIEKNWNFDYQQISVSKKKFGFSLKVAKNIREKFLDFHWVLISVEKKNLLLFLFLLWLRFKAKIRGKEVKIITYCHPLTKSGNGKVTYFDSFLSKMYFKNLDRVIFYTEQSCIWAIKNNYIKEEKAYWANNTIDTLEVDKNYDFSYPLKEPKHIVFIGRLIPSKMIGTAISYFELLQQQMENEILILDIIGDGPDANIVKDASSNNKQIIWHGALIEESDIAPIMKNSSFVFLPGDSGLSINHAFAYGRPYVTLESNNHGPEISYISEDIDGMVLDKKDKLSNVKKMEELLYNETELHKLCDNAKKKSMEISLENWIKKVKYALLNE